MTNPALTAPAPSADAEQPAEPSATDDLVQIAKTGSYHECSEALFRAHYLIERQAREIERWRNVTARADPDDCAAGIKELYGRWKDAEADRDALRDDECVKLRAWVNDAEQAAGREQRRAERAERDLAKAKEEWRRECADAADMIERQAREIERWRNVTARADPDDCAAGIKELYGRWKDAEADRDALRECVKAADAMREHFNENIAFRSWRDAYDRARAAWKGEA